MRIYRTGTIEIRYQRIAIDLDREVTPVEFHLVAIGACLLVLAFFGLGCYTCFDELNWNSPPVREGASPSLPPSVDGRP